MLTEDVSTIATESETKRAKRPPAELEPGERDARAIATSTPRRTRAA